MTRRSILAFFGIFPSAMSGVPLTPPVEYDLSGLIHEYDDHIGNLGRGHQFPVEKIIVLVGELKKAQFVQYQTPGKDGADSRYIQIYAHSGMPAPGVWFGFVREYHGKSQVISFEVSHKQIKDFHAKTGMTLDEAISGIPENASRDDARIINTLRYGNRIY